jgi:hypothetical protein
MGIKIRNVLIEHYNRYPLMQLPDVYKLVHQASMGSGHAVNNRETALRWLEQEIASLGAGPDDPLLDPISPDGGILRIHLRPFLAHGGNPALLLDAFIRTANEIHGSNRQLKDYWDEVEKMVVATELPFSRNDVRTFSEEMDVDNYLAIHHSQVYVAAYKPAYRVVAKIFW